MALRRHCKPQMPKHYKHLNSRTEQRRMDKAVHSGFVWDALMYILLLPCKVVGVTKLP